MDPTRRQITKIAREVNKFMVMTMKEEGIGSAEIDLIHLIRKNPGITQAEARNQLHIDKGAAARRVASLEAKGFLIRRENPADGRSQLLYATEKADALKNSKVQIEACFYEWLFSALPEEEKAQFVSTMNKIYQRCKDERISGFIHVSALAADLKDEEDEHGTEKIQT